MRRQFWLHKASKPKEEFVETVTIAVREGDSYRPTYQTTYAPITAHKVKNEQENQKNFAPPARYFIPSVREVDFYRPAHRTKYAPISNHKVRYEQ